MAHQMKNLCGFYVFHCVEGAFGASSGGTPKIKKWGPARWTQKWSWSWLGRPLFTCLDTNHLHHRQQTSLKFPKTAAAHGLSWCILGIDFDDLRSALQPFLMSFHASLIDFWSVCLAVCPCDLPITGKIVCLHFCFFASPRAASPFGYLVSQVYFSECFGKSLCRMDFFSLFGWNARWHLLPRPFLSCPSPLGACMAAEDAQGPVTWKKNISLQALHHHWPWVIPEHGPVAKYCQTPVFVCRASVRWDCVCRIVVTFFQTPLFHNCLKVAIYQVDSTPSPDVAIPPLNPRQSFCCHSSAQCQGHSLFLPCVLWECPVVLGADEGMWQARSFRLL